MNTFRFVTTDPELQKDTKKRFEDIIGNLIKINYDLSIITLSNDSSKIDEAAFKLEEAKEIIEKVSKEFDTLQEKTENNIIQLGGFVLKQEDIVSIQSCVPIRDVLFNDHEMAQKMTLGYSVIKITCRNNNVKNIFSEIHSSNTKLGSTVPESFPLFFTENGKISVRHAILNSVFENPQDKNLSVISITLLMSE